MGGCFRGRLCWNSGSELVLCPQFEVPQIGDTAFLGRCLSLSAFAADLNLDDTCVFMLATIKLLNIEESAEELIALLTK